MIAMPARVSNFGDRHHTILRYATKRRQLRQTLWDPLWDELCEHFHPDREGFLSERQEGEERRDRIYGSVSELAARSLTAHVATALRPPGRMWFKAKAKSEQLNNAPEVRAYCEQVTRITYAHLYDPRAQFEQQCAHADRDIIVIGTAALQVGWDNAKRHLTIRTHHMKNVVLSINASGVHDMAFVFWPLTVRQVCEMFPKDRWPQSIKDKMAAGGEPDLEQEHEVLHACLPNEDYQKFGFKMGRFPFSSLWISVPDKEVLNESGYYDFPYCTPRWETATGETYGRSPAMVALRDARLHDAMTRSFVESAETALMPPLQAPANMIRGGIDLRPRGLTIYDPTGFAQGQQLRGPVEPIQLGSQPDKTYEFLLRLEERINAAFFRDILELPRYDTGEKMTAAEVHGRLDQYLRQAAPVMVRLEANYSAGIVNRTFGVLARAGEYPDAPEVLQGQEIEFDFESPMKMARDKSEAFKIVEALRMMAGVAEGLGPEKAMQMVDNIDADMTARLLGQRADLPEVMFVPIDKMMAEREARAKQQKMMQMAELAKTMSPAIAAAGGTISKAQESGLIDTRNPLQIPAQPYTDLDPSQAIEGELSELLQ